MKEKQLSSHKIFFIYSEEVTPQARSINSSVFVCGDPTGKDFKYLNCSWQAQN